MLPPHLTIISDLITSSVCSVVRLRTSRRTYSWRSNNLSILKVETYWIVSLFSVSGSKPTINSWGSINLFLFCTKCDSDFSPVKCLQAVEYRLPDFNKLLTWWPISLIPYSTNDFLRTLLKFFRSESTIWDIFSAIKQVAFMVTLKCSLSSSRILSTTVLKFGKIWSSK